MAIKSKLVYFLMPLVILCILALHYHVSDIRYTERRTNYRNILYWTTMFDREDFYFGMGNEIFEGCEVSNCYATNNRNYLPITQFEAIIFHGREYVSDFVRPWARSNDQYYIYANVESPANTPYWRGSKNFFNWTMTYRSDSDIGRPYGFFEEMTTDYVIPTVEEIGQKPNKIAWMVSNCKDKSNRHKLYEKLSNYFPIDVYGKCGNMSCSKDDFNGCYNLIGENYKFYLSFENSICSEYVTEKLFATLLRNIVPIAYGGADYDKIAPPHSVIDATKFNSVKDLAAYIKELDEDPQKYLEYFEWKKKYTVTSSLSPKTLCTLCKKINEPIVHKSYSDIYKWWTEGMCKYRANLPKIIFT